LSRYSNNIESVGLRNCPYLTKKAMSDSPNKTHFAELDLQHGGKTAGIHMI